jgi:hypothetical protein
VFKCTFRDVDSGESSADFPRHIYVQRLFGQEADMKLDEAAQQGAAHSRVATFTKCRVYYSKKDKDLLHAAEQYRVLGKPVAWINNKENIVRIRYDGDEDPKRYPRQLRYTVVKSGSITPSKFLVLPE